MSTEEDLSSLDLWLDEAHNDQRYSYKGQTQQKTQQKTKQNMLNYFPPVGV